jgi:hypothetical protein
MESKQLKIVYTINERGDKTFWTRIGVAYTNRDGSLNVKLDAIPVNGTMQLRDWTPRDDQTVPDAPKRTNGGSRTSMAELDDLPGAF